VLDTLLRFARPGLLCYALPRRSIRIDSGSWHGGLPLDAHLEKVIVRRVPKHPHTNGLDITNVEKKLIVGNILPLYSYNLWAQEVLGQRGRPYDRSLS
jgi:hypothetical protein